MEPSPTESSFNVYSYLENEFFNADVQTFYSIASLYKRLYGSSAYKYLIDTYNSWKSGRVSMSGQTFHRILECVPRCLPEEKMFFVLKCEILNFFEELIAKKAKIVSATQLDNIFEQFKSEIDQFHHGNLKWFVKGAFTQLEINELINLSKHVLYARVELSYRQIINDLLLIKSKLSHLKVPVSECKYHISSLNSTLVIENTNALNISEINWSHPVVETAGRFKDFAEKYLVEEILRIEYYKRQGQVDGSIKAIDVDHLVERVNEMHNRDQQSKFKAEFKGEGGLLSIELETRSIKKMRRLAFSSLLKICALLLTILILTFISYKLQLYKSALFIFWGGLAGGGLLISLTAQELKTLRERKLELKLYERKQSID